VAEIWNVLIKSYVRESLVCLLPSRRVSDRLVVRRFPIFFSSLLTFISYMYVALVSISVDIGLLSEDGDLDARYTDRHR
jgi:hypothetical protein